MAKPPVEPSFGCTNLMVPFLMLVGAILGYRWIGGWGVLAGILLAIPATLVVFGIILVVGMLTTRRN